MSTYSSSSSSSVASSCDEDHNKLLRTRSRHWRIVSFRDIFEDKREEGNLTPYISSLASRARIQGSSLRDIMEALEELGEDAASWRSRLEDI